MKADVVIVGAGIAGSSLAYFLSREPLEVILVDKDYPGLGASGRSAGFLTVQHWNRLDIVLCRASQELFTELASDKGEMQQVGFLRATSREEDMALMRERATLCRREGYEAEVLEGDQLYTRFPSIESSDLLAGIFTPQDGYVDAYDITSTLASRARERGVVMRMGRRVTGLKLRSSKVVGVTTPEGDLSADIVVLAAGAWTVSILRGSGISLPLKPYRTQALVTTPLEGMPNLPMFHELPSGYYFRPDQGGLLLGDGTEYREANPMRYDTHADFALYSEIAAWIMRRVPTLKEARMARGWAGLCVATPDRFPLVGPVEGIEGLYVLVGFNGLGVMRSSPLAEALAETILNRNPSVDLAPLRPGRFDPKVEFPILEGFTLHDTASLSKVEPWKRGDLE